MHPVLTYEELGEAKKIEPPVRVDQEFSACKRPRLPIRQQAQPFDLLCRLRCIASNVVQFSLGTARMIFGLLINQKPQGQPSEGERADNHKCPAPAKVTGDPRHGYPS